MGKRTKVGSIETETGDATLFSDGTMDLDNSGYTQELTVEQVKAAWSGKKKLPFSPDFIEEYMEDNDGEKPPANCEWRPTWDGEYWDFGEELHIIPSKEEFTS